VIADGQTIRIGPLLYTVWVVLWHEVLHGIIDGQAGEHDEGFIEMLAHEIVRVIQDNPRLAAVTLSTDVEEEIKKAVLRTSI
jgi:hypothetical protein